MTELTLLHVTGALERDLLLPPNKTRLRNTTNTNIPQMSTDYSEYCIWFSNIHNHKSQMTFWYRLMLIVCWGWKKPVFWTVESWRGSSSLWISSDLLCTTCVLWLSKRYGVFFILPLSTKPRNIIAAQCPKREKDKKLFAPKNFKCILLLTEFGLYGTP